ncbi:hypothetical protein ACROYT_G038060 [Oculina patagonica]
MTKSDKKEFVERLADEAEEADRRQELKPLYRINKMLNNGFRSSNVLTERVQMTEIPPVAEDVVICTDPPTLEEVKAAIKAMKSGKTVGEDTSVTAEMLKAEETETHRILTDIFK